MKNTWMSALAALALAAAGCSDEDSDSASMVPDAPSAPAVYKTTFSDPSGLPARAAASADFNGDGILDLAVLTSALSVEPGSESTVTIYAGPIVPGRTPGVLETYILFPTASDLSVADMNQDGVADLVVAIQGDPAANPPYPGAVHITYRSAQGGVLGQYGMLSGFGPSQVETADLNGDGYADIVAADGANTLVVAGAGAGSFGPPLPLENLILPAAARLDADGRVDLALVSASDPTQLWIYRWEDAVGAMAPVGALGLASPVTALAAADVNNDGRTDLVAGTTNGVQNLIGGGDFSFVPQPAAGSGAVANLAVGDLNRDGRSDVSYSRTGQTGVVKLLSTGSGYVGDGAVATSSVATSIDVLDADGDGYYDVIAASNAVTVYFSGR